MYTSIKNLAAITYFICTELSNKTGVEEKWVNEMNPISYLKWCKMTMEVILDE